MSEQNANSEKVSDNQGNSDLETAAVAGVVGFMFAGPVGGVIGVASGAMYNMFKRELKKK